MQEKMYYEYVIDEMVEMIKTNLLLYYRMRDKCFKEIKVYCNKREDDKYQKLEHVTLTHFVKSSIFELLNIYLYDFRRLE